ncbi:carbonic anhydrase [Pikeienuella piscinae]|uniref:Carbonic anhydrase n=2 Tax=Pikeienuella piscinae TaxID=2748098 RepID=A0A7M3T7H6_9RHOB|nr:carbonic anhydrase [Pikeienuella piscinae]
MLAQPFPNYLHDRFRAWKLAKYDDSRAWYARLMSEGQHPRAMLISCCDSRLDTVSIFGAEPGDLFVVRNIANLVPPHAPDQNHHGTSAAVEYAVNVLKVAHIVIVGHSNCGGVEACHDMCSGAAPELEKSTSFIGRWMDILRPGYDRVHDEKEEREVALVSLGHEAVRTSLRNLATFPFVEESVKAGMLTLHGAWIDIANADMYGMDPATEQFSRL